MMEGESSIPESALGWESAETSSADEAILPEAKIEKLQAFIDDELLELIKSEKFEDAVSRSSNKSLAKELGVRLNEPISIILNREPSEEEVEHYISTPNFSALNGLQPDFSIGHPEHPRPEITLLDIIIITEGTLKGEAPPFPIPKGLARDAALQDAEEWIHALRYFETGTLHSDDEQFVADYMHERGVELPKHYMQRHFRKS